MATVTKAKKSDLIHKEGSANLREFVSQPSNAAGISAACAGAVATGIGAASYTATPISQASTQDWTAGIAVNGNAGGTWILVHGNYTYITTSPSGSNIATIDVYYNGILEGKIVENVLSPTTQSLHFGNQTVTIDPTSVSPEHNFMVVNITGSISQAATLHPGWAELTMLLGIAAVGAGLITLGIGLYRNRKLRRQAQDTVRKEDAPSASLTRH